jgi:hypothetical protein
MWLIFHNWAPREYLGAWDSRDAEAHKIAREELLGTQGRGVAR